MPVMVGEPQSNFKPAPEGLHHAVCVDVVELGLKETPWGERRKVELVWQIADKDPETELPFEVHKWYTASLFETANLRKDLETWRGRKFTKEELKGFDLEKLLGANCQLQVIHNTTDEKIYANIQAIVPLTKGSAKIAPTGYVRRKDRENGNGAAAAPAGDGDDIPF